MGLVYQTIGMMGSFVIASSLVPQMHKVYKTKSTKDISLRFQVLYVFGLALILVYGFGEDLWPIFVPATVEELAAIVMLGMKLYYDHWSTKPGAVGTDESGDLELDQLHAAFFDFIPHKMGLAYQTIGMMGSFVIASSLVPQMHKVYKTKSAKDISLRFQVLYVFGLALILVYGFGEDLWPIFVPATVEELAAIVMLGMKLYYDHWSTKPGAVGTDESGDLELGIESPLSKSESNFNAMTKSA
ncbi:hypothetical protein BBO99_00004740 [Phytophthora kernoviae]|uniref:Uncharacterized protein n=2 Tax=Phytophthora kernoviae TaxID=325452 RepID=A0A421GQK0_9STRA|nr:hypothetical protein G195_003349 [Phytophthora kernoviae 00238/432]KAG2529303.1 hypothetical protein JM16_001832 [Phytophthora kernoviae]RLN27072.1 hypothetical protein BBI17_002509 [Phytophthora kernoviae]RLN80137.1 hypothetical protein BBO99_00004740 [Phytophthora kernoviae]